MAPTRSRSWAEPKISIFVKSRRYRRRRACVCAAASVLAEDPRSCVCVRAHAHVHRETRNVTLVAKIVAAQTINAHTHAHNAHTSATQAYPLSPSPALLARGRQHRQAHHAPHPLPFWASATGEYAVPARGRTEGGLTLNEEVSGGIPGTLQVAVTARRPCLRRRGRRRRDHTGCRSGLLSASRLAF